VNSEERKRIDCRYGCQPLANSSLPRGNCRETNGSETLPLQYGYHPPANDSLSTINYSLIRLLYSSVNVNILIKIQKLQMNRPDFKGLLNKSIEKSKYIDEKMIL
jgi:hypothetical protein